jgi:nitroreductase
MHKIKKWRINMELRELLKKTRSYRRFEQSKPVAMEHLKWAVENVRYAPSPANLQPLKFIICNNNDVNEKIFPNIKWAAYLKDWRGPEEGEKPAAYILILGNKDLSHFIEWDYGIALETILLSLTEKDYGVCTIAAFNKEGVRKVLSVPAEYDLAAIIAIGKPNEKIVIDDVKEGNIKYWRDEKDVHHVPKKSLNEIIHKIIS